MSILFKPHQSSMANAQGKKLYYPKVLCAGQIDSNDIARQIDERSAMSQGDALCVLINLANIMKRAFADGRTVKINGVGTFHLTAKSNGNGVETAEEVHAGQINNINICFREEQKRRAGQITRTLTENVRFTRVP